MQGFNSQQFLLKTRLSPLLWRLVQDACFSYKLDRFEALHSETVLTILMLYITWVTKVIAFPDRPARAVLPTRCT